MPDNIKQTFSIDAGQAISELDALNAAYSRHANVLNDLADAIKGFPKKPQIIPPDTPDTIDTTADGVNRLGKSVQLLGRILLTQVAVKGFRLLTQGAANSAKAFTEFETGLSQIQALDPTSSLDALSKTSVDLSNQFNVKLMDVVAARLDLVGSGFGNAADQARVFGASANLAKLGAASQAEATDLLISSLNAYGASAQQADRFARVFFAGADKGRFTINELAANLGKAAPAARAVGISIEELTTLFSTLTTRGVSPAEAATQANAVAAAFIKPSKAMKQALLELGVQSGQELIAQKGLSGAIQEVIGTTDRSAQAIGKLFINQRALRPVLTLNADAFKTFNEHLKNAQTLAQQEFDFRLGRRLSTDSERATAAINRLKNAITVGLGGGLVQAASNLDRFSEKLDKFLGTTGIVTKSVESFFSTLSGGGLNELEKGLQGFARSSPQLKELDQFMKDWAKFVDKTAKESPQFVDQRQVQAFDAGIEKAVGSLRNIRGTLGDDELSNALKASISVLGELSKKATVTKEDLAPVTKELDRISNTASTGQELGPVGDALGLAQRTLELIVGRTQIVTQNFADAKTQAEQLANATAKTAQNANLVKQATAKTAQELGRSIVAGDLMRRVIQAGEKPLEPGEQLKTGSDAFKSAVTASPQLNANATNAGKALERGAQMWIQASQATFQTPGIPGVSPAGFATGGFAKGTDTIPAMLSPGEYVINAKSTRRFFSQLQAINAGVAPIYRAEGGPVVNNNTTIGDIVVQGGNSGRATARTIAQELRREFRRGTSSL